MHNWARRQKRMGDDPPFLTVGTEVSAKYKGAFCEAKVRKVVRSVKCKVTFKLGLGTLSITDDQIRGGTLRVGSVCEVKHPEKKEFVEAIINKIQDCSQYTVVFDDGDITTLRRTALCLKSGRHFAESETLDQLPLTHPEHFSNPVIGGRKGRRSRQAQEETSDEEDPPKKGKKKEEKEADIGKVVCVELGDKKKQKDNWFPGLVVAPTAQDTVRIRVKDEYLVRSFKDGRYFTVPKKEATEFTREIGNKVDNHTLKGAVEKALQYLDRDELPPHWDRDLLFGLDESSGNSDSDGALDSDSSDDEPREEKDHFVAQLYKFMDDRGTPINRGPTIGSRDVDLYKLFKVVHKLGGYNRVTNHNQWKTISQKLGFGQGNSSITNLVKQSYKKFLHSFEDFYRKLGCTMVNHPRGHRSRHRTGRSLIRDRDRTTPTIIAKDKEKKEEKSTPAPAEKAPPASSEAAEKESSSSKCNPAPEKKEEEKPREEEKKEETKPKESTKKSKTREDKTETQNKQKGKDACEGGQTETEEKESRSRSKKDSKASETKVPRIFEDLEKEETDTAPEELPEPEVSEETKPSRETKSKTRESKPKERSKVSSDKSKSKEEKIKISEEEKSEDSKKKVEKKTVVEEDEKLTRAKSKDELKNKKEGGNSRESQRETRTPVRESANRPPMRPKKEEEGGPSNLKKRGRKRKETDEKAKTEESMGHLASHVTVCIGDKLKVYYGPTHESKVTYEAKVLDIEEDGSECMYLVHYTGWNTRYDEWIKRGRIADNLSWTPSRAKRQRQQQSQHKTSRPSYGKRGRPSTSGRSLEGIPNPPRSTTPSSVTSSSSRTKSPATRTTPRTGRNTGDNASPGHEFRRRTRRMSGHTDISMASDSESEEEFESEIEPESEMAQTRSRTTEQRRSASTSVGSSIVSPSALTPQPGPEKEEQPSPPVIPKEEPIRRAGVTRKKSTIGGKKKDSPSAPPGTPTPAEEEEEEKQTVEPVESPLSTEKRRSRRGKRSPATSSCSPPQRPKLTPEVKSEMKTELNAGTESEEECVQPKGRDFDLNQIRSELKGIEKAVKSPVDLTPPPPLPGEVADDEDEDDEEERIEIKQELEVKTEVKQERKTNGRDASVVPALFADIEDEEEEDEDEEEEIKVKAKELVSEVPVAVIASASKSGTSLLLMEEGEEEEEEDVYEFKEPEPFEFEVRKTLLLDSKGLARRPGISSSRIFELPVSSPDPSPPALLVSTTAIPTTSLIPARLSDVKSPRKRPIKTPPKDSPISESSKKIRRTPQKKLLTEATKVTSESKDETFICDTSPPQIQSSLSDRISVPSPLTAYSPSRSTLSSIELSYEKLCTTEASTLTTVAVLSTASSTQTTKTTIGARTLVVPNTIPASSIDESPVSPPLLSLPDDDDDDESRKSPELGPLSIFSQGQDDDGDDDHEDRLVISESDDMVTEIAEPLFSYQQRDHEDLFPTLVTSAAVVTATEATDSCKGEDPPCLSPVVAPTNLFRDFSSPLRDSSDISLEANVGPSSSSGVTHGQLPVQQLQMQHKQQQQPPIQQPPQLQQQRQLTQQFNPLQLDLLQLSKQQPEPSQLSKHQIEQSQISKQQVELPQATKQVLEQSQTEKLLIEPSHSLKLMLDEPQQPTLLLEQAQETKRLEDLVQLPKQQQEHKEIPKQQPEQSLLPKQQQEQIQVLKHTPEQPDVAKQQPEHIQLMKQTLELTSVSKQLQLQQESTQLPRFQEELALPLNHQQEKQQLQNQQPISQTKSLSPLPVVGQRTATSSPAKSQSSIAGSPTEARPGEDVIKDLLKQQVDDYNDDSINAAIQRALDRSIIDEEDEDAAGDMELFCGKTLTPAESNDSIPLETNVSLMIPQKDSPLSSASPGHTTESAPLRKRVSCVSLGSSFLDLDDSADSSDDEGQRLIIDPMDDEGSSQPQSCSSPLSSSELRLHISEEDPETHHEDTEDDGGVETAVDDELRTEDEEAIEGSSIVITRDALPTVTPDDYSSTSEAVTSAPVVTEEDTMETDDLPSTVPVEEEQEDNVEDDDSLEEESCNHLSLHPDAAIDVSDRRDIVAPVMTPVIVKVDLDDTSKLAGAEILSGGVVVLDASSELSSHGVDQSLSSVSHSTATTVVTATIVASSPSNLNPQSPSSNIDCEGSAPSDASPILALAAVPLGEAEAAEIRQETRNDDADSQLLGSLLCQETIPGSPAQAGDGISDDQMPESKVLVLEMPFASVPASSCNATGSTMSLPVPISVPLNIPVVTTSPVVTTTPTSTTTAMVLSEELPNVAETVSNVESATDDLPIVAPTGPVQHLVANASPSVSKLNANEAAPVMENTPPTTPDSTLSTMSGSPREEHGEMSPTMDNESSKSHRDSFEMDLDSCPEGTKVDHFSEDDSLLNVEVSNTCDSRLQGLKLIPKKSVLDLDKDSESSPKKRRRSRKRSESESNKRARCSSSRSTRPTGGTGSDSDDTSENSALGCTPMASSESTLSSKSPRPSKYNFYVELDPELDGSQRIALLQQKLQELRKTYMNVKAELACIDRRRKKLRRREREVEKATKQEVACS